MIRRFCRILRRCSFCSSFRRRYSLKSVSMKTNCCFCSLMNFRCFCSSTNRCFCSLKNCLVWMYLWCLYMNLFR